MVFKCCWILLQKQQPQSKRTPDYEWGSATPLIVNNVVSPNPEDPRYSHTVLSRFSLFLPIKNHRGPKPWISAAAASLPDVEMYSWVSSAYWWCLTPNWQINLTQKFHGKQKVNRRGESMEPRGIHKWWPMGTVSLHLPTTYFKLHLSIYTIISSSNCLWSDIHFLFSLLW